MHALTIITQIIAATLTGLAALLSILLFTRLHWPSPALWVLKLYVSALSYVIIVIGVLSIILGLTTRSVFITMIGMYVTLIFSVHAFMVTRPPEMSASFENVFGADWEDGLNTEQKNKFLPGRLILRLPATPEPRLEQNIPFAKIPNTERQLLCDIWLPASSVTPSGLAFIYLHGGAWYLLDKDLGTRPFFRHLAAQGHVIMDVAYRLSPETDMMGMVNDAKRAIVWMKENAATYKVDPDRIVVGGGSSGGHLALMAAYTWDKLEFAPKEHEEKDMNVCGVISIYGPSDLEAMYYHDNQHKSTRAMQEETKKSAPAQMPAWIKKSMGEDYYRLGFDKEFEKAGAFAPMLGGRPDEIPEIYSYYSPSKYAHPGCPPTLLLQGKHDVLAPVKSTRTLYASLVKAKVQTIMNILPQTDHAFDLILPKISPSAHNAIYDVERFLALMVKMDTVDRKTEVLKSISMNSQRPAVLQLTAEND